MGEWDNIYFMKLPREGEYALYYANAATHYKARAQTISPPFLLLIYAAIFMHGFAKPQSSPRLKHTRRERDLIYLKSLGCRQM
jgi:hypothetical protein